MNTNTNQNKVTLTSEQREILDHTLNRAPGGNYCGDSKEMGELVSLGLMEFHRYFLGNPYFRITSKGVSALRDEN